jgi:hypothetical protein
MQNAFLFMIFVVCGVKAQVNTTATTTTAPCRPSAGEAGDNNYAVLKRNCYSRYGEPYSPKFFPLTKGVLYTTSQAAETCGRELSVMFYGAQVCISFTYEEYRWANGYGYVLTHSKCEKRCFAAAETTTILERKYYRTSSYRADSESKSNLELIITPNHNGVQPTVEPCHAEVGEAGSLDVAILKRTWCQSYTKKICFSVLYTLEKGVPFMASQANRTYGRDVSVIFYGKEVCIAYMYERFGYSLRYSREILQSSYCRKTCFTGTKSNQQELSKGPVDPFNPTLTRESDYELIVATERNVGTMTCKTMNFVIPSLSILMSMFVLA